MPTPRKTTAKSSLAGAASDQVRAIIEAAEQTAAQIRAAAEDDAERIRRQARDEARRLVEGLRREIGRLEAELGIGEESASRVEAVAPQRELKVPAAPPELETPVAASQPSALEAEDDLDVRLAADAAVGFDESEAAPVTSGRAEAASAESGSDVDLEGARLVALNMALDGASREQVDRYLRENYQLSDRAALLDEVYASVGS
jgi:hypothetical protein